LLNNTVKGVKWQQVAFEPSIYTESIFRHFVFGNVAKFTFVADVSP